MCSLALENSLPPHSAAGVVFPNLLEYVPCRGVVARGDKNLMAMLRIFIAQ